MSAQPASDLSDLSGMLGGMNTGERAADDAIYEAALAEATELGLMSDGKATDRCQCTMCGAVFSTVGNFDRHRAGDACHSPADVGLIQHVRGWWHQPGSDDAEFLQNRAS